MTRLVRIIAALACLAALSAVPPLTPNASAAPRNVFAAPDGSPGGDGTKADPLDLQTALTPHVSPARPGDTVLLRGGTYEGSFTSGLEGRRKDPINVRSYPGEWAVIDPGTTHAPALIVSGHDTWFRDFEVTRSDPDRTSSQSGAGPTDISRGGNNVDQTLNDGVAVYGARTRLINLVIHDSGNGIGFWDGAIDAQLYGCVVYNNGFVGADRAWGHAVYAHNNPDSGRKRIKDLITFNNFAYGIHAYNTAPIERLDIGGVVSFQNGAPAGAPQANILVGPTWATLDGINVYDNLAYHAGSTGDNVRLGFTTDPQPLTNGAVHVKRNVIIGSGNVLVMQGWSSADVTGNRLFSDPDVPNTTNLIKLIAPAEDAAASIADYNWRKNRYFHTGLGLNWPQAFELRTPDDAWVPHRSAFQEWRQTTGLDAGSSFDHPLGAKRLSVRIRPNRYQKGRATITVLNWDEAGSVQVALADTRLRDGQRFEIRDVQNFGGEPLVKGRYRRGRKVTLPLDSTTVSQPIGGSPEPLVHTPSSFGVFVILPVV